MAKIRTFVAVEVAPGVHSLVKKSIDELSVYAGDYRWQRETNLHLTLNFLGDIQEKEIPEVCRCVEKAVRGIDEFPIEIGGLGAFPRPDRPRVLWLGVSSGVEQLVALQQKLTDRLYDEMGFPPDRNDFTPHVTLGRANRSSAWSHELVTKLNDAPKTSVVTSFVDEVIVFSSHMDRSGPTYTPMSTIELGMGPKS